MPDILHIDLETYCEADLKKVGVYKYAEHPSFKILLWGYALNFNEPEVIESLTIQLKEALESPSVLKVAHNASFEMACLARAGIKINPAQWRCTMVMCKSLGYPGTLAMAAEAMQFQQQKDKEGSRLIRLFSTPSKKRGDVIDWQNFKNYCAQDVRVERLIYDKLKPYYNHEAELWETDYSINKRGVLIDTQLVEHAITMATAASSDTKEALQSLTSLDKVSRTTIKAFVEELTGEPVESLDKKAIPELIKTYPALKSLLEQYSQLNKTSVAKFAAMLDCQTADGTAKGLTQYYGAGKTGRWAGRLIQLQNLPQILMTDKKLDTLRQVVKSGDAELFRLSYNDQLNYISQLIMTAIIPSPGNKFVIADFSAIEARVLAWLAGERWRLDVFTGHGRIYETSAEKMFNLPEGSIDKWTPEGHALRQKGKIAELALGYGGGAGALQAMGALNYGLSIDDLQPLVNAWRGANKNITYFWRELDNSIKATLRGEPYNSPMLSAHSIRTGRLADGSLQILLPSGRYLTYVEPSINVQGEVQYLNQNQVTNKWEPAKLYGAKAAENVVQATARDCLAHVLLNVERLNFCPRFHVHDEIVCDVPEAEAQQALDKILDLMQLPGVAWAKGLPLKGDGFIAEYYSK